MKKVATLVGYAAILAIASLPLAYIAGSLSLEAYKATIVVLTAIWYATAFVPKGDSTDPILEPSHTRI